MFGAARSEYVHRRHGTRISRTLNPVRNLLIKIGFETASRHYSSHGGSPVPANSRSRSFFPSMPKDFIRRRRVIRNLSNILLIGALSLGAAYVITRPVGGTGFTLSSQANPALVMPPAQSAVLPADLAPTVVGVAARSADPAPPMTEGYDLAPGPHAVTEVSDLVLHDANRNKDLHVRVFYPAEAGKYPVIIFSHGAGGSQSCCETLTLHWASYGYVTVQPTHDDSAILRRNSGEEKIQFAHAVRDALNKPALWESRPEDISFVIDSLTALQNRIPGLQGKIDAGRIGVAGHSMGSYAAEAVAGARIDLPGHSGATFADPRVKAVLCLSPQGPGQFGLTEHSFDRISLPYLGVTGSLDSLGPLATPAWHRIPFDRRIQGDKFQVYIQGADHMSFISARSVSMTPARADAILGYTNSAALAFWDAYLKEDTQARIYLNSDRLEAQSHNAVKITRR